MQASVGRMKFWKIEGIIHRMPVSVGFFFPKHYSDNVKITLIDLDETRFTALQSFVSF